MYILNFQENKRALKTSHSNLSRKIKISEKENYMDQGIADLDLGHHISIQSTCSGRHRYQAVMNQFFSFGSGDLI